jgi:membrane protein
VSGRPEGDPPVEEPFAPVEPPAAHGPPAPEGLPGGRVRRRADELRGRADDLKRQATSGLETATGRYPTVRWIVDAYDRDRRRFGGMLAGGLAFKLFLWLLPYALLVVAIVGYAASYADKEPEEMAKSAGLSSALVTMVAKGVESSGRGRVFLLFLGAWLTLWSGRGLVRALGVIQTAAWDLPVRSARGSWRGSALLLVFLTVLFSTQFLEGFLYAGALGTDLLASLLMIAITGAIWLLGWSYLPRPDGVPWTALIPGSLLLGVSMRVIAIATTVYFAPRLARADDLYGSIGIATVFLAWLFIVARLVVAATFLNASRWFAAHPPSAAEAAA